MPNITLYLNQELFNKFINSDEEIKKKARADALNAIEKGLADK